MAHVTTDLFVAYEHDVTGFLLCFGISDCLRVQLCVSLGLNRLDLGRVLIFYWDWFALNVNFVSYELDLCPYCIWVLVFDG